ncbi:MAG: N-acetylneuraminate synthase [Nitrospirae bacterium RBG_19FT_COMBO_42_15]|nr:MAG: N-acetylneuraminate synthase [Nitrospirae bacterium RBG_19FT_COMBO_42_15]
MRTFIIAEAGVNHNGNMDTAIKLIDMAKKAGADAIKFQTFKSERLVTRSTPKAKYQKANTGSGESQLEMLKRLELTSDNFKRLFSYCRKKNIIFMSTPFDEKSADMLDRLGMGIFKIPSGEITNKPLIQHIAGKNKPVILSTGMSYLSEVEKAVRWIYEIWNKSGFNQQLTLLHCVSDYPAHAADINLYAMNTLKTAFGLSVGYSDHTLGIEVPIAAVAIGAKVIEKHFTLDKNMKGPDHKASLEPDELKAMVKAIRNVEKAMGDGIKRPTEKEDETRIIARRSLVAKRDLKKGDVINSGDIIIKRPGSGILPEFKETIRGMKASKNIIADSVIKWGDLKDA